DQDVPPTSHPLPLTNVMRADEVRPSLSGEEKDDTMSMAAADPGTVKPVAANNKLDTQLANLSADAENFADRASRTQERIDLKERQAAEKKKREEEAARKEALRPKFLLPVARHGLSAYFGQAGVNWMSVHTGIDFPVSYGTPVMAATDGTVRTQWNSAYGNMAIVTTADGTETWYCHLSSTKIRSGPVKAGDVIAYSGNSGNSTGPHLHFEVRPGGGAAIDPLPWLRSHGLDPT
ncbi:peptidoglycan DD-metalloendopeptidase family protein, partial [Streptomyces sp. NPDC079189]|uniref:peptidoglycan DD-metalloendopeptidase family protein n=1 Tax=Streptomyces sp. NPDC079189 TaxID=3154514 RepID=UPI00341487F7